MKQQRLGETTGCVQLDGNSGDRKLPRLRREEENCVERCLFFFSDVFQWSFCCLDVLPSFYSVCWLGTSLMFPETLGNLGMSFHPNWRSQICQRDRAQPPISSTNYRRKILLNSSVFQKAECSKRPCWHIISHSFKYSYIWYHILIYMISMMISISMCICNMRYSCIIAWLMVSHMVSQTLW